MAFPICVGFVTAVLVSLLVIPPLRSLAHRWNLTDRPDAALKPHQKPTAYLGGVGIYLGLAAGVAGARLAGAALDCQIWRTIGLLLAGGAAVLAVGLIDDVRGISPRWRVAGEAAVAALLFAAGVRFEAIPGLAPGGPTALAVGLAFQLAFVLGACNATNLLDGLDGLCGGVVMITMIGLACLAGGVLCFGGGGEFGDRLRAVLLLAPLLAGALLGFLRYNYRPASIFMGDGGSLLLGFLVAGCLILLAGPGGEGLRLVLAGLAVFGVGVTDSSLAIIRRAVHRVPLSVGDRNHFYDQLVSRGRSVGRTVNLCYLLGLGFAALGWTAAVFIRSLPWEAAILVAIALAILAALWRLGFMRAGQS